MRKFLLFSSLLGLGFAQQDQADCQSVPGGACDPNADCLDAADPAADDSYCRCRWGYRGVGSAAAGVGQQPYAGCTLTTNHSIATCGDGVVQAGEDCDFGIVSLNAATPNIDEANGNAMTYSQRLARSGNCGATTDCQWDACPWRIARNAPTPLVRWVENIVGSEVNKVWSENDDLGNPHIKIGFALWYPKLYHSVMNNPYNCDEIDAAAGNYQQHATGTGALAPYDDDGTIAGGDMWHWPTGRNIGAQSIDLNKVSKQGVKEVNQTACQRLNAQSATTQSFTACTAGSPAATCEQGWHRQDSTTRGVAAASHLACAHTIYYHASFLTGVSDACYTVKSGGAGSLSYFTSYLRVHNVEVDLDVEDLRHAQYVLGNKDTTNGNPGGFFSRIFTRRTVDIELPFFITFNRTVEATAELAVTSSLFGFSAVVDYVEYIINAFGTTDEFEDGSTGSTTSATEPGLGGGSGSITLATSINPGYKLAAGNTLLTGGAGRKNGGILPNDADLSDTSGSNVQWGEATDAGGLAPYVGTSFGCAVTTDDPGTLDAGTAHRCEQFWKYTVKARACSFQGIFSAIWDVKCNKAAAQATCPGAASINGLVFKRDANTGITSTTDVNTVAITFTLDPGPDDCVQEFKNDVVLSAALVCGSSREASSTTEVFHNQMLFCTLTITSGVSLSDAELIRVENRRTGHDAVIFDAGTVTSGLDWATTSPIGASTSPAAIDFDFRVTPKQFKQDFDARNPWTIYAQAKVTYADGTASQGRRLLSMSNGLRKQRERCLENGCADIGPIRSLLQLDEDEGGQAGASSKAYISGLDYQPDVPVIADDVYLADLDMGMEDEDAAAPVILNTLVLAGLGFLAMH